MFGYGSLSISKLIRSSGERVKDQKLDPYYSLEDYEDIEVANLFEDLFEIALRVLMRMPQPVGEVCGPISTGGAGSIPANLLRIHATIDKLRGEGRSIFSQMPFEDRIQKLKLSYGGGWHRKLLEGFYRPIFASGFVKILYFMPDWQSSLGATWERNEGITLGLWISDL